MLLRDHSAEDARVAARSLDLTTQNNGVLFNALRKFPLAVQYFLVHFVSCQAPSPSTTINSAYSLGVKTIETSALRAVPRLHEHLEQFAVEAVDHRVYLFCRRCDSVGVEQYRCHTRWAHGPRRLLDTVAKK